MTEVSVTATPMVLVHVSVPQPGEGRIAMDASGVIREFNEFIYDANIRTYRGGGGHGGSRYVYIDPDDMPVVEAWLKERGIL